MLVKEQPVRESVDSTLAKNLVAARLIVGFTQHELAHAADVSRATIAQLETGSSDPRLSTIVDLARALGIAPIVLLAGTPEVEAFASLSKEPDDGLASLQVFPADVARMRDFLASGLLKDRLRAARLGAAIARSGLAASAASVRNSSAIAITAGLFSATLPGAGTILGAALGSKLNK